MLASEFVLDPSYIMLNSMLLSSHPKTVREAITKFDSELDKSPGSFWLQNFREFDARNCQWAARYLGCSAEQICLVDSATVGLGLIYNGLLLDAGSEILVSDQEHYATLKSIEYASSHGEFSIRKMIWYDEPATVDKDRILSSLKAAISEKTRVIAITWVHSSTGVKLPVAEICHYIGDLNKTREQKILTVIDGVHALGVEDFHVNDLGCDLFVSSCHKWLFGPRGTGLIYLKPGVEAFLRPSIPTYNAYSYENWRARVEKVKVPLAHEMAPGGFQSFSHKWALYKAFEMHLEVGKKQIQDRTYGLAKYLKERLSKIPGIRLLTPISEKFSAALVVFDVEGVSPSLVVDYLAKYKILATVTPYFRQYVRFSPAVYNTQEELDIAVDHLCRGLDERFA